MDKVGVIGSGEVGRTLADGFLRHGYAVMRGSRDPAKLGEWKASAGAHASTGDFSETARYGDLVVLAVKGSAAEAAVRLCGAGALAGRVVIDATNPIADVAPQDGVLTLFTEGGPSLMERLQALAPKARFVKAFSCVGSALMVDPDLGGTKPTMFLCGDDGAAKRRVEGILEAFGWEWEDMGGAIAARAIEPLCVLWCIPGFVHNRWRHAFKLLE
jgi:8-hydroxy-5-deazaflavin:NADPH oxidoreductase